MEILAARGFGVLNGYILILGIILTQLLTAQIVPLAMVGGTRLTVMV
jgi:hypothetical protein